MRPEGWPVVVDLQQVFRDEESPWTAPRFDEIRPDVLDAAHEGALRLLESYAPLVRVVVTADVLGGGA